jgi:Spy/CpxP family protein refolding chaperone
MHRPHLPPGFDQLNLTDTQKAAILQILKDTEAERRQKIDQLLSAEQKAQLEQLRAAHHAHEGNGGNPPPQ